MSRIASQTSPMAVSTPQTSNQGETLAGDLFDRFCEAKTMIEIMSTFQQMCEALDMQNVDHTKFYRTLRSRLKTWKAQSLWAKLDKRASQREYRKGLACQNTRVLIIGSGPCGLRAAIEVALLGGKSVVVEKRDRFSRNNVLHLWPFLIHDLKTLGAKKFFGKFCAGAIDHISIRTLQCILLKCALLVGVEVHPGTTFDGIRDPDDENSAEKRGWRAWISPKDHAVSEYEYDVLIGADGKRNTLPGFKRKEFRGKLAIAITANFINRNTQLEARVEEISGVAFIFNQKFFKDLYAATGIDLENIVYYKDETHYFVMTAKKQSLLKKGVLLKDYAETEQLLARENVDQERLLAYAKEAADVSTNHQLPFLDFAHNHYGQADIAMFDFTSLFAAEYSSRIIDKHGHKLLMALVGDSLLEPFWPTGSGCARGFLGALDTAWMIRSYVSGKMTPLEVLAERESIYQLLSQTTPENMNKNFHSYTLDPNTRYRNLNSQFFKPHQVRVLYEGGDQAYLDQIVQVSEERNKRYERIRDYHHLLRWFQKQLDNYQNLVKILDLTTSWRNGIALCALIHKYRPNLIDVYSLDSNEVAKNNQMAFDLAEKELSIPAVMTGQEMAQGESPDKLTMVSYLSQFYEVFKKENLRLQKSKLAPPEPAKQLRSRSPSGKNVSKLSNKVRQRRDSREEKENHETEREKLKRQLLREHGIQIGSTKKRITDMHTEKLGESKFAVVDAKLQEAKKHLEKGNLGNLETGVRGENKVSEIAKELGDRFLGLHKPRPLSARKLDPKPLIMGQTTSADYCYFCQKKVYLVERQHAEGIFFHRWCLKCDYCGSNLRLGSYAFIRTDDGEAKFYCFQHYGLRKKTGKLGKRIWGDTEVDIQEERRKIQQAKLPDIPTQQILDFVDELPPVKIKVPPRRSTNITPTDITDALPSPTSSLGSNKTPERIEFENVFDGAEEESELEQTAHNLSSSCLDLSFDEDGDSDSDDDSEEEEEEEEYSDGDDPDLGFAAYETSCKRAERLHGRKYEEKSGDEDADDETETETETPGASDDWESDTETEKESDDEYETPTQSPTKGPSRDKKLLLKPEVKPKETKPSPTSLQLMRSRMSFFSATPQVVSIDAKKLFGLGSKEEEAAKEEPADTVSKEEVAEPVDTVSKEIVVPPDGMNKEETPAVVEPAENRPEPVEAKLETEQEAPEVWQEEERIMGEEENIVGVDTREGPHEESADNEEMVGSSDDEIAAVEEAYAKLLEAAEAAKSEEEEENEEDSDLGVNYAKDEESSDEDSSVVTLETSENEDVPETIVTEEAALPGTVIPKEDNDEIPVTLVPTDSKDIPVLSEIPVLRESPGLALQDEDVPDDLDTGQMELLGDQSAGLLSEASLKDSSSIPCEDVGSQPKPPVIIPVLRETELTQEEVSTRPDTAILTDAQLLAEDLDGENMNLSAQVVSTKHANTKLDTVGPNISTAGDMLEPENSLTQKDRDVLIRKQSDSVESGIQGDKTDSDVSDEVMVASNNEQLIENVVHVVSDSAEDHVDKARSDSNGVFNNRDFRKAAVVQELSPEQPPLAESDDFDVGEETPMKENKPFTLAVSDKLSSFEQSDIVTAEDIILSSVPNSTDVFRPEDNNVLDTNLINESHAKADDNSMDTSEPVSVLSQEDMIHDMVVEHAENVETDNTLNLVKDELDMSKNDSIKKVELESGSGEVRVVSIDESFITGRDSRKKKKRNPSSQSANSETFSSPPVSLTASLGSLSGGKGSNEESMDSKDLATGASISFEDLLDDIPYDETVSLDTIVSKNIIEPEEPEVDVFKIVKKLDSDLKAEERTPESRARKDTASSSNNTSGIGTSDTSHDATIVSEANTTCSTENSVYLTPEASLSEARTNISDSLDDRSTSTSSAKLLKQQDADKGKVTPDPLLLRKQLKHDGSDSSVSSSTSSLYSPGGRSLDAKKKFFSEAPQPVRLDHYSAFSKDGSRPSHRGDYQIKNMPIDKNILRDKSNLSKGKQGKKVTVAQADVNGKEFFRDSGLGMAGGTPPVTNSESDAFFTPSTSVKGRPTKLQAKEESKSCLFQRSISEPAKSGLSEAPLSPEEVKKKHEEDRQKAREEARKRARLLSDEQLGLNKDGGPTVRRSQSVRKTPDTESTPKITVRRTPSLKEISPDREFSESPQFKRTPSVKRTPFDRKSETTSTKNLKAEQEVSVINGMSSSSVISCGEDVQLDDNLELKRTSTVSSETSTISNESSSEISADNSKGKEGIKEPSTSQLVLRRHSKDKDKDKKQDERKRRSFLDMFLNKGDKKEKAKPTTVEKTKSPAAEVKSESTDTTPERKPITKIKEAFKVPAAKEKEKKKPREKVRRKSFGKKESKPATGEQGEAERRLPMPMFSVGSPPKQSPLVAYLSTSQAPSLLTEPKLEPAVLEPPAPQETNGLVVAPKASVEECVITDVDSEFDDTASVASFRSTSSVQMSDKYMRKMKRAAARQQRQAEMKRLRMAQEIQRQLEEVEIKMKGVEDRGVEVEQGLHKEGPKAGERETDLMEQWFNIVHEKNALVRYQSELMVHARELELEDRQARLQQQLREHISNEDSHSDPVQREKERKILAELLEVVEQRDVLVAMLEEDRLRSQEEDRDLQKMMLNKGFHLSPISYKLRLPSLRDLDVAC